MNTTVPTVVQTSRTIVIEPITRIEGHAKVTIRLDAAGRVAEARFHVTEFRGFEQFCVGRSFWEMPGITARICGICPVSHLLASAKAGDALLGVSPPPAAHRLRRLMNWAQIVQSHALSFFHLSGPDLLLGMESDPAQRNLMGLIDRYPDVAKAGIRLRRFGQEIIRLLGGQSIHPAWSVPGGVREPLTPEKLAIIAAMVPEAQQLVEMAMDLWRERAALLREELAGYDDYPTYFLGLVGPDGELEHYDGTLRVVDSRRKILVDNLAPERYESILAEATEPWSYLKFPYFRPGVKEGEHYRNGAYRVGPLARLNLCDRAGTPKADAALRDFRALAPAGQAVTHNFHYHFARLIEIQFAIEKIAETLEHPELLDGNVRARAGVNRRHGVGVSEAPRGTLFHDYQVDANGLLTQINLVIATGQNNLALNRTVTEIAAHYIDRHQRLDEGVLNRIEHGIRQFDPCLSCSTHAIGHMGMVVEVVDAEGAVVERVWR